MLEAWLLPGSVSGGGGAGRMKRLERCARICGASGRLCRFTREVLRCTSEVLRFTREVLRCALEVLRFTCEVLRCTSEVLRFTCDVLRCTSELPGCGYPGVGRGRQA